MVLAVGSISWRWNGLIPKDPVMLLSYLNTQLRDFYPSLNELCASLDLDREEILSALSKIQYTYREDKNQFVSI